MHHRCKPRTGHESEDHNKKSLYDLSGDDECHKVYMYMRQDS